jgi:hypothetical protein
MRHLALSFAMYSLRGITQSQMLHFDNEERGYLINLNNIVNRTPKEVEIGLTIKLCSPLKAPLNQQNRD